jgi:hypothetical protein
MKIKTTITLTRDEVLKALTQFVRQNTKYGHDVPHAGYGDVLGVSESPSNGWLVEWGQKPDKEEEAEVVKSVPTVDMVKLATDLCCKGGPCA